MVEETKNYRKLRELAEQCRIWAYENHEHVTTKFLTIAKTIEEILAEPKVDTCPHGIFIDDHCYHCPGEIAQHAT